MAIKILHFLYLSLLLMVSHIVLCRNDRPIIGILSQSPSSTMVEGETKDFVSYIAASYVKFVEMGGARVVPILINQDKSYYTKLSRELNGIVFPGGSSPISNTSGYGMAGQYLYEEVLARNAEGTYLPLWCICLGFEMLMYLSSSYDNNIRVYCDAENLALPIIPEPGLNSSRQFSNMPESIYEILVTENVTSNFHGFCVTKDDFYADGLDTDYQILSTNLDINNFEFISMVEHKTLPIFGAQWHPEKNSYIWKTDLKYNSIPHFPDAIYSSQYFANFLNSQARLNNQSFATEEDEESNLIYGHYIKYMGNTTSSFEQVYLFE